MQKEYDIDAYLNWSVCMYAGHKGDGTKDLYPIDPYTNPIRHNPDNMKFANGDGYLFYPMAKYGADTPIPSMRLLSARDGQEDYDTLCALEKAYATGKTTYSVSGDPLKKPFRYVAIVLTHGFTAAFMQITTIRISIRCALRLAA